MDIQKNSDLKAKFLHAIANDTVMTKLWKYRSFLQTHRNEALHLKDRMLDLALKNKLLGQYELIQQLLGVALINIPRTGDYNTFKIEMQTLVNKLKVETSNYELIGKYEEQIRGYFKIGQVFAQYGDHRESQNYFSKILRKQTASIVIRQQEYLPLWGKELFYLIDDPFRVNESFNPHKEYQDLELFAVRTFEDNKKINSTLALIRDVYRLSKKGRGKGRIKVLESIMAPHFKIQDIINNQILSMVDLGLMYSLLGLAFKDRAYLKQDIKWSSKIQIAFLQSDYKKLFVQIAKHYESYGQFNPTIRFIFPECNDKIKIRVITQIINSYQSIQLTRLEAMTGFKSNHLQKFVKELLKQDPLLPFLFDPITQSIVSYEKTIPLYNEAMNYYNIIKEKYAEKEKALFNDTNDGMQIGQLMFESKKSGGRKHYEMGF